MLTKSGTNDTKLSDGSGEVMSPIPASAGGSVNEDPEYGPALETKGEDSDLIEKLESIGLNFVRIPGDGSCFFTAALIGSGEEKEDEMIERGSNSLSEYGRNAVHNARVQVFNELTSNYREYIHFISNADEIGEVDDVVLPEEYRGDENKEHRYKALIHLSNSIRDGAYANHVAMTAWLNANNKQCRILCVNGDFSTVGREVSEQGDEGSSNNRFFLYHDADPDNGLFRESDDRHFSALISNDGNINIDEVERNLADLGAQIKASRKLTKLPVDELEAQETKVRNVYNRYSGIQFNIIAQLEDLEESYEDVSELIDKYKQTRKSINERRELREVDNCFSCSSNSKRKVLEREGPKIYREIQALTNSAKSLLEYVRGILAEINAVNMPKPVSRKRSDKFSKLLTSIETIKDDLVCNDHNDDEKKDDEKWGAPKTGPILTRIEGLHQNLLIQQQRIRIFLEADGIDFPDQDDSPNDNGAAPPKDSGASSSLKKDGVFSHIRMALGCNAIRENISDNREVYDTVNFFYDALETIRGGIDVTILGSNLADGIDNANSITSIALTEIVVGLLNLAFFALTACNYSATGKYFMIRAARFLSIMAGLAGGWMMVIGDIENSSNSSSSDSSNTTTDYSPTPSPTPFTNTKEIGDFRQAGLYMVVASLIISRGITLLNQGKELDEETLKKEINKINSKKNLLVKEGKPNSDTTDQPSVSDNASSFLSKPSATSGGNEVDEVDEENPAP